MTHPPLDRKGLAITVGTFLEAIALWIVGNM